jgi:hypothetical protein
MAGAATSGAVTGLLAAGAAFAALFAAAFAAIESSARVAKGATADDTSVAPAMVRILNLHATMRILALS